MQSDLVLLGHYHTHARVTEGMWYTGSTDTFSFADEPDRPKGIVVLDTDRGECRHVPLQGQRPLVTLEPVFAVGLSPAELQARVEERAGSVPEGAVARLYLDGVDPDVYRLLDLQAAREAARAALLLKLEPQFLATAVNADLPTIADLGGPVGRLPRGPGPDRPGPGTGPPARPRLHRYGHRGGGGVGVTPFERRPGGPVEPGVAPCC